MTELENDGVGHPDSGCGRPQNVPRCDLAGLPPYADPDLHRAPDPAFDAICLLEGPESPRERISADLPGEVTTEDAREKLEAFSEDIWGEKDPTIAKSWKRN